jgi:mRNA-degrading endonuclease RelE of RelBE toxin-antitoxin system
LKQIEISNSARKDLKNLDKNTALTILRDILPRFLTAPELGVELSGDLRGLRSFHFTLKGTHYRIIYELEQEFIGVIKVSTRENVYKELKRRL